VEELEMKTLVTNEDVHSDVEEQGADANVNPRLE
jgi:hypothetical protein